MTGTSRDDPRDDEHYLPAGRPRPLVAAARQQASLPTVIGTVVTALATTGVLTRGTVDALSILLAVAAVLATGGTAVTALARTIRAGEAHVTPVDDPVDHLGEPLVPRTGQQLAEVLELILDRLDPPADPTGTAEWPLGPDDYDLEPPPPASPSPAPPRRPPPRTPLPAPQQVPATALLAREGRHHPRRG